MSPYVVTTKRPCPACVPGPNAGGEHRPESVSRVAVGTLEEAKEAVWSLMHEGHDAKRHSLSVARARWAALAESGGSVGPLPDGTVIEVTKTNLRALDPMWPTRYEAWSSRAEREVIAAFNARQAS